MDISQFSQVKNAGSLIQGEMGLESEFLRRSKAGTILLATVVNVRTISESERKSLIEHLKSQLNTLIKNSLELNNKPSSEKASVTSTIQALENKLAALGKQIPQLVQIRIGTSLIDVLSQREVSPGEKLSLRLRADGQLDWLQTKKTNQLDKGRTEHQSEKPGNSPSLQKISELIKENLRVNLPKEKHLASSLSHIQKLLTESKNLPSDVKQQVFPNKIWQKLQALIDKTIDPSKNKPTSNLKNSVSTSGIFLESNITQLIKKSFRNAGIDLTPHAQHSQSKVGKDELVIEKKKASDSAGSRQASLNYKLTYSRSSNPEALGSPSLNRANPPGLPQSKFNNESSLIPVPENTIRQDTKFLLLNLLEDFAELESKMASRPQDIAENKGKTAEHPLMAILKSLGSPLKKQQTDKRPQQSLIQQTRQTLESALARVQGLQLRSLSQQHIENVPSPTLTIELALKINDNIYPLILYLQEKIIREKDKNKPNTSPAKRKAKTANQWQVFMEFDLEEEGKLASEISILENSIHTSLWSDNTETREKLQDRVHSLKEKMQRSGLIIDELQVQSGNPPQRSTQVRHQLLDIQT